MPNRQQLRQSLIQKRRALSNATQQLAALHLTAHLTQTHLFSHSLHIATYLAHQGEMNPMALLQNAWSSGKNCYLPVLAPQPTNTLSFVRYAPNDRLIENRYHILEPIPNAEKTIAITDLDLVLVPLVAFDLQGNRLGMGAGYYDRTFAALQRLSRPSKPYLLGLAYSWQQVDELQTESWDVKLDGIATEEKFYSFTHPTPG